jgi:hypothetical protein
MVVQTGEWFTLVGITERLACPKGMRFSFVFSGVDERHTGVSTTICQTPPFRYICEMKLKFRLAFFAFGAFLFFWGYTELMQGTLLGRIGEDIAF